MKRSIGWLVLLMSVGTDAADYGRAKTRFQSGAAGVGRGNETGHDRTWEAGHPGPYFMGYEVNETATVDIEATQGALESSNRDKVRVLDVEVRVGDYALDNTHQIRGSGNGGGGGSSGNGADANR